MTAIPPPFPAQPPVAMANGPQTMPAPPPPTATVSASGVSKHFKGLVAVSDVSFAIQPGVTALLGPNGAGKSTLLRMLSGQSPTSQGSVWVAGGDPRKSLETRRQIGIVPQQDGVFERDTIFEFVKLAAVLNRLPDPEQAALGALHAVEMDPNLDRPMGTFSKGMRQRAKIASAIVHDPSVLFLDEPLNGLDPKQRRHMIELFHNLGQSGRTVLVSSHVLDEVERFGSRVLVIANGRLAAQGDFRAIRALMDDQPLRYRVVCSDSKHFAAHLIARGLTVGTTILDQYSFELTTLDALKLRRSLAAIAKEVTIRLFEVSPLDADLESVFRYLVGGRHQ